MKPILVLVSAVAASAATSYAIVSSVLPRAAEASPALEPSPELARVRETLAEVQREHDALRRSLDAIQSKSALQAEPTSRVPLGEIEAAVARALEAQKSVPAAMEREAKTASAASPRAFDARAAYQELMAPGLSWDDAQAKWKAIVEAGELDAVVAMFEEMAKDRPQDPEAQVELGKAYLQKVFKAGGGPEAGVWATKADASFDDALTLDDHNWEARFNKAVSLSFWPPVFGKQTEAIKHFEILVAQQGELPQQGGFAETHVLLGNMYQQMGEREKALGAWRKGLALFPDHEDLKSQIANAGSN